MSESELDPSDRLQRKEDDDRLKAIVEYLRREQQQRFFNSLVVAMLGEPQWRHFKEISRALSVWEVWEIPGVS